MKRSILGLSVLLGLALPLWSSSALACGRSSQSCGGSGHDQHPAAPERGENDGGRLRSSSVGALHGGHLIATQHHYFETVHLPGGIGIYFFSKDQTPLLVGGARGTVSLELAGGEKKRVELMAETPQPDEPAVYFCPMHPRVMQPDPGSCSICGGMALAVQDRLFASFDPAEVERGDEIKVKIQDLEGPEDKVTFRDAFEAPATAGGSLDTGGEPSGGHRH